MSQLAKPWRFTIVVVLLVLLVIDPVLDRAPARANIPGFDQLRSFGPAVAETSSVVVGDMNGDGHLDIVTGTVGQDVVYLNDGKGNFNWTGSARLFGTVEAIGVDREKVAVGDLDGDGDLDIVGWHDGTYQTVQFYLNDGNATFDTGNAVDSCCNGATGVSLADLNSDGALDIIVGKRPQNLIYLNDNTGTSPPTFSTTINLATTADGFAPGDLNNDGLLDVVVGSTGGAGSAVYLNDHGDFYTGPGQCDPLWQWGKPTGGPGNAYSGQRVWAARLSGRYKPGEAGSITSPNIDLSGYAGRTIEVAWWQWLSLADKDKGNAYVLASNDGGVKWETVDVLSNFGSGAWTRGRARLDSSYAVRNVRLRFGLSAHPSAEGGRGIFIDDINMLVDGTSAYGEDFEQDNGGFVNDPPVFPREHVRCLGKDTSANKLVVGDMNGDGYLDVITSGGGQTTLFLNDKQANFDGPASAISIGGRDTRSVAVADINGDGHLDLVVGNYGQQSTVYLNDGADRPSFATSMNFGPANAKTTSVAVADLNEDGALDLVVGRAGQQSVVQLGAGGIAFPLTNTTEFGESISDNRAIALGDLDADGDLDIVAGTSPAPDFLGDVPDYSAIYYNNGAGTFLQSQPLMAAKTTSIAIADLNKDYLLDIIVGNDGTQSVIYLAERHPESGDIMFLNPTPFGGTSDATLSLATADLNGDDALDLIVGNNGQDRIYLNDKSGSFNWSGSVRRFGGGWTASVASGDMNGDGALDLVTGNTGDQNLVYLNDGVGNFDWTGSTRPFGGITTTSVAVGDVNGDGALDIAVGNREQQNVVYLNDGTGNFDWPGSAIDFGTGADATTSIAVGDINGDGALDIAVGNQFEPGRVYVNDRGSVPRFTSAHPFGQGNEATSSIALGDLNGDGTLDLVVGNQSLWTERYPGPGYDQIADGTNQVHLNRARTAGRLPNHPPYLRVKRPGMTPNANFYSTTEILASNVIPVSYTLFDPDQTPIGRVAAFYSLDGGANWQPAVPTSDTQTMNLASSSSGTTHVYKWDTFASGVFGHSNNLVLRFEAYTQQLGASRAGSYRYTNNVPGPIHLPYATASTFPFRVRGTQVRVVSQTQPQGAAGALVYRLPAGQTRGAHPIGRALDMPFRTDIQGYLQGRGKITVGDRLIVLAPVPHNSIFTHNNKFTLYHTNARPTPTGLDGFTVSADKPGVQTLTVSSDNSLILFNLAISLEWDARADPQFMNQLRFDLQRTSELLYDWSDGQAALGQIGIYHGKQHWEAADIRVYASNRLRPNATQGGIVSKELVDPANSTVIYEPGEVRMGPSWSRAGDDAGTLGDDWPRALAHELGHYTLFLDDNYLGINPEGLISQIEGCRGAMTDPYRDDYSEFMPPGQEWDAKCKDTVAERTTGRSDWETIRTFYQQLRQPDQFNLNSGPSILPLAVTQITEFPDHRENLPLIAPTFALVNPDGTRYLPSSGAKAFLFPQQVDAATHPGQVIDLGQPKLDQVLARGARVGDKLCFFDLAGRGLDGQQRPSLGCQTITVGSSQLTIYPRPGWQPEVLITTISATHLTIHVPRQGVGQPPPATLSARLFPADVTAQPISTVLTLQGDLYTGSFAFAEGKAAFEGTVHVWTEENAEPRREVVADFRLGGNPAPPRRPRTRSRRRAPVVSADGQVILYADNLNFKAGEFFSLQSATALPAAVPPWTSLVGQSYRLLTSSDALFKEKVSINIGYLDNDVPPGTEAGIAIYYHKVGGTAWEKLDTALSPEHNEATAKAGGPGVYALMTRVEMLSGWNIFSYPWLESLPVPQALALINVSRDDYTTVYGYESNDANDPWKVYDIDVPDWVNDLKQLDYGRGYWINVTDTAAPVRSSGADDSARAAAAGSLPYPPATYYGPVPSDAGFTPRAGLPVVALIDDVVCGETVTKEQAGEVVFAVDVIAAGVGESAACGVHGRRIVFKIDGQVLSYSPVWDNRRPHAYSQHRTYLPLIATGVLQRDRD